MSFRQKLLGRIFPEHWTEDMEAESRNWILRCKECGLERSVWELGDVRWKAVGSPSRYRHCPRCDRATWHVLYRRKEPKEDTKPQTREESTQNPAEPT